MNRKDRIAELKAKLVELRAMELPVEADEARVVFSIPTNEQDEDGSYVLLVSDFHLPPAAVRHLQMALMKLLIQMDEEQRAEGTITDETKGRPTRSQVRRQRIKIQEN